ncbi:MAG: glycosyltransferase family 2 protein [Crocinitomicaceae bacterium]|nr:glycosyltransferase family 2 protein [Crocinitomicaceae bacterium]
MKKTAVVILNYNGKGFLEKFLPGVLACSQEASVILADNCSTDDSVSFLKNNFPEVEIILNNENGGFAKGYNDALRKVQADYYVLLNSDIEVTPGWLEPCIQILDEHPDIAAVQPKILAWHDKTKFEHAGAAGGFLDKDYYPFCQGRIFENIESDNGQYNENREIFWATGACMFVRAKLYHESGGLDDSFFAHMEEIDLCWRLKTKGHKIYYCAQSHIYHVGGGTLNYMNPKKTYLNFRNSLYMITKNYQGVLFFKIFKRLCLDGIAASLFLFKFQFRHFGAVFNAHMSYYGQLSVLLKKRKELKQTTNNFNAAGLYKRNIVFKKFLGGVKTFHDLNPKDFN